MQNLNPVSVFSVQEIYAAVPMYEITETKSKLFIVFAAFLLCFIFLEGVKVWEFQTKATEVNVKPAHCETYKYSVGRVNYQCFFRFTFNGSQQSTHVIYGNKKSYDRVERKNCILFLEGTERAAKCDGKADAFTIIFFVGLLAYIYTIFDPYMKGVSSTRFSNKNFLLDVAIFSVCGFVISTIFWLLR